MRFCTVAIIASLAFASLTSAVRINVQGDDKFFWPHLAPRQASSSSMASSSSSAAASSTSSASGSTTTTISDDGCTMSNTLSPGQSSSWSDATASTCCTNATATTCFIRMQNTVTGNDKCTIPSCTTLLNAAVGSSEMVGFKALSSTTGTGANNNTFVIQGSGAGTSRGVIDMGVVGVVTLASLVALGITTVL